MKVARIALMLLVASCHDPQPPPRVNTPTGSSGSGSAIAPGSGANMSASVTATLVGSKPGRPPIEYLLVDLQVKNDDTTAHWVLVPRSVPFDGAGGVDKNEQQTVTAGGSTVAVGRFLGRAGLWAVRLAPGARVTLRKLEVSWWRKNPGDKDIAFDVQLATDVKIGDASMTTWFDKDPTITGAVDLDMSTAKHTTSHKSPDGAELSVTAVGATSTPIKLAP